MIDPQLLSPKLPLRLKGRGSLLGTGLVFALILFLPWVSFTAGNGIVTAINPNERVQTLTTPLSGFIRSWYVKEGDEVKEGQVLAELIDNDPDIIERMSREQNAGRTAVEAATLMHETSKINLERQKSLLSQGLTARKDYEKAKIEVSKLAMELAKAQATLTKAETQLSRQYTQRIVAPRDGVIIRITPGERGLLLKAGTPIAVFSPITKSPAVEVWVDGNDASLVVKGQPARLQFEGWPSLQVAGWPSVAINTFKAKVHLVDQASSHAGKFRVLLVPDGPWPSQKILRLGNHARGYITLSDSFILREVWRVSNGFPAFSEPIKDELNKLLTKQDKSESEHGKEGSK